MPTPSWLLLLFNLPAGRKTERVSVWRRLKKLGAVQLTTSTYVLPDRPALYELFQWLAKQIRDYGGDATLIRAQEIEGLSNEKLIQSFNSARETEYGELGVAVRAVAKRGRSPRDSTDALEKLKKQFRAIREIDFFDAPRGREIEVLLRRAEEQTPKQKSPAQARLAAKQVSGSNLAHAAATGDRPRRLRLVDPALHRRESDLSLRPKARRDSRRPTL